MFDDFLLRSLLAGILMVLVAAPMGCLMVWQRMAFLADTLGHAAVLGVAIGLVMSVNPVVSVLVLILVLMLIIQQTQSRTSGGLSESLLAIVSYTGLSAGILILGISGMNNISLDAILFGDLLATSEQDLWFMAVTVLLLLGLLWHHWSQFVAVTISQEIAQAEGISVQKVQLLMYLMVALLIAVMMKIMGVLLIGAMLVIPVNAARVFSKGPEQMVLISLFFGLISLFSGMYFSWHFDLQTGPAIVVVASFWLILAVLLQKLNKTLT